MFSHIVGNDHIKVYLQRMIDKKAIGNSLLFAGPEGIGKSLFARAFAKALICFGSDNARHPSQVDEGTHPDIHIYRPEGKLGMHSIDSMRSLSEEVYMSPYVSKWKVFIVHDAERMLTYSANALLKTFEEPSADSVIILLSSAPEKLLTTIMSRCRTVRFHDITDRHHHVDGAGGHVRTLMLNLLAKGRLSTYQQLTEAAKEISEQIEQAAKADEESSRADVLKGLPETLTAVQKLSIEKELEGVLSMRLANDVHDLFVLILEWYRDMHLLHVGGKAAHIIHRDYKEALEQSLQKGYLLPLETVQNSIADVKLAFERSTSLTICLENLFLQLLSFHVA